MIDYIQDQLSDFTPTEDEFQLATAKINRPMMGVGSSDSNELFTKTYKSIIYEPDKYSINKNPVSYDNLKKLARAYFHPSNMIISVVSPLPADSIHSIFQWPTEPQPHNFTIDRHSYMTSLKPQTKPIHEELKSDGEQSFLFWGFVTRIKR